MNKKKAVQGLEKKNKTVGKKEVPTVELDSDLLAIVDAQCSEHGVERSKFLHLVIRLFVDFSYMARIVGKDIFAFRDEMIKAIVRGKGMDAGSSAVLPTEAAGTQDEDLTEMPALAKKLDLQSKKIDEMLADISEIKFIFKLIKRLARKRNINVEKLIQTIEAEDFAGKMGKMDEIKNITVDHLASGFKNSTAASYGDKRRKLQKIKF